MQINLTKDEVWEVVDALSQVIHRNQEHIEWLRREIPRLDPNYYPVSIQVRQDCIDNRIRQNKALINLRDQLKGSVI